MAPLQNLVLVLAIACIITSPAIARDISPASSNSNTLKARLTTGLKDDAGLTDCWNALLELRSCSNEIVLFFLNGQSYLGLDCCYAIRTITHQCWPSMLTSLGFTAEEGDILRGYCDAETAAPPAAPPSASKANDGNAKTLTSVEIIV